MLLRDALRDPDNVTAFLLLQLHIGIECTEVELLHVSVNVQAHLVFEELVFQRFVLFSLPLTFEERTVLSVVVCHVSNLFKIISPCKCGQTIWIQLATVWVQLCPVLFAELSAERVDRNNECPAVGLES